MNHLADNKTEAHPLPLYIVLLLLKFKDEAWKEITQTNAAIMLVGNLPK